jgi:pilus assembly protein CpaD
MTATARKDSINMARKSSLAALVALGAALAACSPTVQNAGALPNRSLDSVNQPVVQRTDYVIDLTTDGDGLAASERGRLEAWFASLGLGYGDRVWVDESYGPSRSRDDVARVAAEYGLLLSEGAPVTAGNVQPGSLRVIVSRSTASVPGCPHWEGPGGPSATSPNYGCAVNSNIAAMVADPSDLVLGQAGSGTGDSATAAKAIKVYRETPPTGTKGLASTITHRGNN